MQKHQWYAQCLTTARAARNVETQNWDGSALECGSTEMNSGNAPAGFTLPGRRLMDAGSYGGSYGGGYSGDRGLPAGDYGYGSGSRGLPGSYGTGAYGSGSRDLPGAYAGGDYGSASRDLPMEDSMPPIGDAMPAMADAMPSMGDAMPAMGDAMPPMADAMPAMADAMPPMGNAMPPMDAMAPMMSADGAPMGECSGEACKSIYEQCGGGRLDVVACCEEGTYCIKVCCSKLQPVSCAMPASDLWCLDRKLHTGSCSQNRIQVTLD